MRPGSDETYPSVLMSASIFSGVRLPLHVLVAQQCTANRPVDKAQNVFILRPDGDGVAAALDELQRIADFNGLEGRVTIG